MKRLLHISLALFWTFWTIVAYAQQGWISPAELAKEDARLVSNVKFTTNGDKVMIGYSLASNSADVSLYVSVDGGKTYSGPLFYVSGDAGRVEGSGRKVILWDVLTEYGGIHSDMVQFYVLAKGKAAEKPVRILVKAGMGLGWFEDTELCINAGIGAYDIGGSRFGVDATFYTFPSIDFYSDFFHNCGEDRMFGVDASLAIRVAQHFYTKAGAGWFRYITENGWETNGLSGNVGFGFRASWFYVEAGIRLMPTISIMEKVTSFSPDDSPLHHLYLNRDNLASTGGIFPFICIGLMF